MVAPIPQPSRLLDGEQRRLPQDLPRGHAGRELSPHGLGDHEAEIVGQAVVEPTAPMARRIAVAERRLDPDLAVTHLDRTGRNVIGPEIERAAARQIEAGVMPMTGEDAVLDAAAIERKAHMRAAVVEREDASPVVDHQDRGMAAMHARADPWPSARRGCTRAQSPRSAYPSV